MKISLFSKKRWVHTSNGVTETELPSTPLPQKADWVLSRGLCFYQLLPVKNIALRDRKNALAIRLRQLSPWQNTGSYIVCQGDWAQLWLWDEAARSAQAEKHNAGKSRPVPETLLQQRPEDNGPILRQCLDGVELQYWQDDILLFSHWWQSSPAAEKLIWLLRTNDFPPPAAALTPQPAALLTHPWAKSSAGGIANVASQEKLEQMAWLTLLFTAVTLATWFGSQHLQLKNALEKEQSTADKLQAKLESTLQNRSQAAKDLHYLIKVHQLDNTPCVTMLFAQALEIIADHQAELTDWNYRNPKLTLELIPQKKEGGGSGLNESAIIAAFEKKPFFRSVSASAAKSGPGINLSLAIATPHIQQHTATAEEKMQ